MQYRKRSEGSDKCRKCQRDDEQKSDRKDHGERKEPLFDIDDKIMQAVDVWPRDLPDRVERVVQLDQHARGAKQKSDRAGNARHNPMRCLMRAEKKLFNNVRTSWPDRRPGISDNCA